MKNLLAKFRLSNALDDKTGGPLPDGLQEKISANPELRDFAQRAEATDRALRNPPGVPLADSSLHNSIMRAVRASSGEPSARHYPMAVGLATAGLAMAVAVIGIWIALRPAAPGFPRQSNARSLAAAQAVLDMGGEISRSVPSSMVGPLANELACVDHDIQDTTKFVLAMLPY